MLHSAKLLILSVCAALVFSSATNAATTRAAVLPFEIHIDLQMDGMSLYGLPPKPKKSELERLELARAELIKLIEDAGIYEVIDLDEHRSDIRRAAPFDRCDGCEVEFGERVGAEVTLLGVVRKASELMINIAIYERDVRSKELKKSMLVSVLQNDDTGWLRAVRHMVKNRLVANPQAQQQPE